MENERNEGLAGSSTGMRTHIRPVSIKSSVLDAMLIIVFSLCIIGIAVSIMGIFLLNGGIWKASVKPDEGWKAGIDILRGIINILIGSGFIFGSYFFMKATVEKREWWGRIK